MKQFLLKHKFMVITVLIIAVLIFIFWDDLKKIFNKKTSNINISDGSNQSISFNSSSIITEENKPQKKSVIAFKDNVGLFPRGNTKTVLKLFKRNQKIGDYEGVQGPFVLVDYDGIAGQVLATNVKLS